MSDFRRRGFVRASHGILKAAKIWHATFSEGGHARATDPTGAASQKIVRSVTATIGAKMVAKFYAAGIDVIFLSPPRRMLRSSDFLMETAR
jgi:hypothetical protein